MFSFRDTDRLADNIAGNLTKIFLKSQMPRGLPGGGWVVLELTGTLADLTDIRQVSLWKIITMTEENSRVVIVLRNLINSYNWRVVCCVQNIQRIERNRLTFILRLIAQNAATHPRTFYVCRR